MTLFRVPQPFSHCRRSRRITVDAKPFGDQHEIVRGCFRTARLLQKTGLNLFEKVLVDRLAKEFTLREGSRCRTQKRRKKRRKKRQKQKIRIFFHEGDSVMMLFRSYIPFGESVES